MKLDEKLKWEEMLRWLIWVRGFSCQLDGNLLLWINFKWTSK